MLVHSEDSRAKATSCETVVLVVGAPVGEWVGVVGAPVVGAPVVGAGVGAPVVGAGVGASVVGADALVGAEVGALVGALVGAEVGAEVGAVYVRICEGRTTHQCSSSKGNHVTTLSSLSDSL